MIYLDNAATTMHKPQAVVDAVVQALNGFGGAGRGVHGASLSAGMVVFEAREEVADLFNAPSSSFVSFTSNVTESLNMALRGLLEPGDHAVTTAASHNSVLRPLKHLNRVGVEFDVAPVNADGTVCLEAFETAFKPNTKVCVINHASNLTGDVYDIAAQARIARDHGALVVVDAAQTAGIVPIDMAAMGIDVLCFTGHKSLYGPQGTGGICLAEDVMIKRVKVGGSGSHSYNLEHPENMPDRLEAGTLNGHGIAGLGAGIRFVKEIGIANIAAHEQALCKRFEEQVADIPGIRILGGPACNRTGIVALNIGTEDSGRIADALSYGYGIATRAGAHCAPLMHKALGTEGQGAVRFSTSWFTTEEEIDTAARALHEIAGQLN